MFPSQSSSLSNNPPSSTQQSLLSSSSGCRSAQASQLRRGQPASARSSSSSSTSSTTGSSSSTTGSSSSSSAESSGSESDSDAPRPPGIKEEPFPHPHDSRLMSGKQALVFRPFYRSAFKTSHQLAAHFDHVEQRTIRSLESKIGLLAAVAPAVTRPILRYAMDGCGAIPRRDEGKIESKLRSKGIPNSKKKIES